MRGLACLVLVLVCGSAKAFAEVTKMSASAAVGAGSFDSRAAGTLDLGLDVSRGEFRLGLGGRLRFVAGDGLREADWDESAEGAGFLRYATFAHVARGPEDTSASLAIGQLSGVRLGQGTVIDGYTAGLNVDHLRTGLQARLSTRRIESDALTDDLTRPRILAGRSAWRASETVRLGATLALDLFAPDAPKSETRLGVLGAEATFFSMTSVDGLGVGVSMDLVDVLGVGVGAHLGMRAAVMKDRVPAIDLGAQVLVGTEGYLPGWFSPLYELTRRSYGLEPEHGSQLAVARRGEWGGGGGRLELRLFDARLGHASFSWLRFAGTNDRVMATVALPYFHSVQVGAWLCVERSPAELAPRRWNGVLTSEVRFALPSSLFVSAELARLYHESDGYLHPLWITTVAFGAVLDK